MIRTESQFLHHRRLDQPNADTPDGTSSASIFFDCKSVSNIHLSETPATSAGTDQKAASQLSLMTRMTHRLFRSCITTRPSHENLHSWQDREATTLEQLEAIMDQKAFAAFQEERGKETSRGFPATYFGIWYNKNKSNPGLKQILTEQKDTDAVKALKSQIVLYEMGALERLNNRAYRSGYGYIPRCLRLKAKDLFDRHNNYLVPNPKMEFTAHEIEKVLAWYCLGAKLYQGCYDGDDQGCYEEGDHVHCDRNLERTFYSDSEIARKLKKCLAVREQRALDALAKRMPDEAFKAFLSLMEEETEKKLESGNPLLDWYNSSFDGNPKFLKPWCDKFWETKALEAYHTFLTKCRDRYNQKFKEIMGEEVYDIFCRKLPSMLPRSAMIKNEVPLNYRPPKSSDAYRFLETVNSWLEGLSDDQRHQLFKGEVRNSPHMDWLKLVTGLFQLLKKNQVKRDFHGAGCE